MAKTKKSIDTEVNDRFISFFSDRKISITEAAQEIGLTRETFYNIRDYKSYPSAETLLKAKKRFSRIGFSSDFILTGESQSEMEKEFISKIATLTTQLEKVEGEKTALFNILGKSESMTKSLLIDTEKGVDVMNALLGQKAGHALSKRMQ